MPVLLHAAFVEHAVGRGRRPRLQLRQGRPRPPGEGKGEQRQQAIALDLHQLLQDMAAEHGIGVLLHHDEAGEAVGTGAKIGRHLRHAAGDRRADHVLGEDDGPGRLAEQFHMRRRHDLPRQGRQPILGREVEGGDGEGGDLRIGLGPEEGPGGDLRVALPAQAPGGGVDHAPARVRSRLRRADLATEGRHMIAIQLCASFPRDQPKVTATARKARRAASGAPIARRAR